MIFFPIDELNRTCKGAALNFVKNHEPICVQLAGTIKKSTQNVYVCFANDILPKNIYGILSLRKTILHCLPFTNAEKITALQKDFSISLSDFYLTEKLEPPLCVNGTKSGSSLILQSIERLYGKPSHMNEYQLMQFDIKSFRKISPIPFYGNESVVRCKKDIPQNLMESLAELQKNYELEEVLPDGFEFNEDNSRLRLKNALRTQYVLALNNGKDQLVSKAATNAIGFCCIQIGGVYTANEHRRKNYSYNLLLILLRKIVHSRKTPVLYVKKSNIAACRLYEKLHFTKISDYIIAYFSHKL